MLLTLLVLALFLACVSVLGDAFYDGLRQEATRPLASVLLAVVVALNVVTGVCLCRNQLGKPASVRTVAGTRVVSRFALMGSMVGLLLAKTVAATPVLLVMAALLISPLGLALVNALSARELPAERGARERLAQRMSHCEDHRRQAGWH